MRVPHYSLSDDTISNLLQVFVCVCVCVCSLNVEQPTGKLWYSSQDGPALHYRSTSRNIFCFDLYKLSVSFDACFSLSRV